MILEKNIKPGQQNSIMKKNQLSVKSSLPTRKPSNIASPWPSSGVPKRAVSSWPSSGVSRTVASPWPSQNQKAIVPSVGSKGIARGMPISKRFPQNKPTVTTMSQVSKASKPVVQGDQELLGKVLEKGKDGAKILEGKGGQELLGKALDKGKDGAKSLIGEVNNKTRSEGAKEALGNILEKGEDVKRTLPEKSIVGTTALLIGVLVSSGGKGLEGKKAEGAKVLLKGALEKGDLKDEELKAVKSYTTEYMTDINGIGLKWDETGTKGTILMGNDATLDDAFTVITLDRMKDAGYNEEQINEFINKYREGKDNKTLIAEGKNIDYYTNFEEITKSLTGQMIKNEYENHNDLASLIWPSRLDEFRKNVQNGGPWDLKQLPEWDNSSLYTFNGEIVDRDAPGNIMYGYMGNAYGIPNTVLKLAASYAQLVAGTSKPEFIAQTLGDDPIDQKNIERGIDFYNIIHFGTGKVDWGTNE